eukprot:s367_g8.t1
MSSVADLADTPTPPIVFGTADDLWLLLVERSRFECPGSMPIVGLADCAARDNADGKSKSPYGPGGIYHEKQVGSLCALHCVNNLLQKPAYDDGFFRMVAMELDSAERRLLGGDNLDFGNARMDGFYNVQVVQEVLRKGNYRSGAPKLEMLPISSEAAKECKIDRVKETAFILNKNEHWFSLRRIGAEWFDLNSCLPNPAHYTPGDLDFHIRDAVREGYSVFVVRGTFPKCELEEEHNHKKLLEAVQGCGRPGQTYSLFAGSGQTLSSGGGAAQPTAAAAAAPPASNDAAALRAARLARFGGGGGPAPASPEAAPAPAPASAAPAPAPAVPAAPAPPAVPEGNPALEQLVSMGFDREQSKNALEAAKGNVEQAAELLLSS